MADAQVLYAESLTGSANSTTWVDLATIAAGSFTANHTYLILANQVCYHNSSTNYTRARLVHGTTPTVFDDASLSWEGTADTQYHELSWMYKWTQPGTAELVKLQISCSSTTTVTNRLSQIIAIDLDGFTSGTHYFWAEDLVNYTMTATPTAKATTASFTPNGTDVWLYIGHQIDNCAGSISTPNCFDLYDSDVGVLTTHAIEGEDANDIRGANVYWVGVPANMPRTVRVHSYNSGGNTMLASRVVALNLTAMFAQNAYAFDATGVDPATVPTYTTVATVAPTPSATGNWVVLGWSIQNVNETSTDWRSRLQINPAGGGLLDYVFGGVEPAIDNWDATDEGAFSGFTLLSLSSGAPRTINWDWSQATGTTGRVEDNGVVAFSVAMPAGGTNAPAGCATGSGAAYASPASVAPNAGHAAGTGAALDPTISTGISVQAGLAEGTGAAYSPPIKYAPVGLASGVGAANAPPASIAPNTGVASGTGAAFAASEEIAPNSGLASGTGSAYPTTMQYAPAGLASGTGAAYSASTKVDPNAGAATGAGAASAALGGIGPNAGNAAGTGAAPSAAANPAPNAGSAEGTGAAYATTMQYALAGQAAGTGAAYGASETLAPNAGLAEGTGAALEPTVQTGGAATNVYPDCAAGTGSAYGASTKVDVNVEGGALGTGSAFAATATVAPSAGVAAATGAGLDAGKTVAPVAGVAAGTGAAYATAMQYAQAGHAAGTGTAATPAATVATSAGSATGTGAVQVGSAKVDANAGSGAATGAAYQPAANPAPNAGLAAGTGAAYPTAMQYAPAGLAAATGDAYQPTVQTTGQTNAPAGLAAGTGAAGSPVATVSAPAGVGAATGAANAANASLGPPAGVAAGTGEAGVATANLVAQGGEVTGTGAAYQPTVQAVPYVYAPAGLAEGAGAALAASPKVDANATDATGTGAALDPTVTIGGAATYADAGCATGTGAAFDPTAVGAPSVFAWTDTATGTGAAYGVVTPTIEGVTRDENGAVIPLCTVDAFVSSTNAFYGTTTSDAQGRYSIVVAPGVDYFLVAYSTVEDVYGVTARDLTA